MTETTYAKNHMARLSAVPPAEQKFITFANGFPTMVEAVNACDDIDWLRDALLKLPRRERVKHVCALVRGTPAGGGKTVFDLLLNHWDRTAIEEAERWAADPHINAETTFATAAAAATKGFLTACWVAERPNSVATCWQRQYLKTQVDWAVLDLPSEGGQ